MSLLWQTPDLDELILLVLVGLFGGAAQFMLFEGMKRAAASVIAPFEYTSLIWSFVLGYLIWGDIPRRRFSSAPRSLSLAGLIIIGSERFRTVSLRFTRCRPANGAFLRFRCSSTSTYVPLRFSKTAIFGSP